MESGDQSDFLDWRHFPFISSLTIGQFRRLSKKLLPLRAIRLNEMTILKIWIDPNEFWGFEQNGANLNNKAPILKIQTKNGAKFEILKNGANYENFNEKAPIFKFK